MEFSGTFELEETTTDEVWLALSDPVTPIGPMFRG